MGSEDLKASRKPDGFIVIATPEGVINGETWQCCHCGKHHVFRTESKRLRGWCQKCDGFFCGPTCEKCVPFEQWLENREAGRPDDWTPTRVFMR